MSEINKVTVKISGKEYTLKGVESPEYMHKIALFIDRKMNEILRMNNTLSTSMVSVLAAINVAEELLKTKEAHDTIKKELNALNTAVQKLEVEKANMSSELNRIREENNKYQLELVKKEAELKEVRNSSNSQERANRNNK